MRAGEKRGYIGIVSGVEWSRVVEKDVEGDGDG